MQLVGRSTEGAEQPRRRLLRERRKLSALCLGLRDQRNIEARKFAGLDRLEKEKMEFKYEGTLSSFLCRESGLGLRVTIRVDGSPWEACTPVK